MKNFITFGVGGLLAWTILYGLTFGQNMTGEDMLRTMKSIDATFTSEMTLVIDEETAANILRPDEGYVKSHLVLTVKNGSWGIERKFGPDFKLPLYRKMTPDTQIDYDNEGNLIAHRQFQRDDLQESDFRGTYFETSLFRVSPNGSVSKDSKNAQNIQIDPSPSDIKEGGHYYFGEFRWLLWAAGRGFTECLNEITDISLEENGLLRLNANGWEGMSGGYLGRWELVVDPKAAYMVRSAAFTYTGQTSPSAICETVGTKWFDNACIPEQGKVIFVGLPERRSVFVNYVSRGDEVLLSRLRSRLRGVYPNGTNVDDFRSGSETPLRYTIGEIPE